MVRFLDDPESKVRTAKPAVDADHGRIETRTATVSTDINWLQEDHHWPGLAAIGKVMRIRKPRAKPRQRRPITRSATRSPANALNEVGVRFHWGVENRLHWRLDVVMNEDQAREPVGQMARTISPCCGTWL